MNNINVLRSPVKGDIISIRGSRGTSPRTKWKVVTHADADGFATLKSTGNGKTRKSLINASKVVGKQNPAIINEHNKRFKFHN
jgi:hypothetical protein